MKAKYFNYANNPVILTISDAFIKSVEEGNDYYGTNIENTLREFSLVKEKVAYLIDILAEKKILSTDEVSKLIGFGFDVVKD